MSRKKPISKPRPLRHMVEIDLDNPGYNAQHPESRSNPRKVAMPVSMRESPALWLYGHGRIDYSQLRASSRFRSVFETAGGGVRGLDYLNEPVDGGRVSDGMTDRKIDAANELVALHKHLGSKRYTLVEKVCGECLWLKELDTRKRRQLSMADDLRDILSDLAVYWGYATKEGERSVA